MFEYPEERADLHSFRPWQSRKMAIDVVGKMRVDAGNGQTRAARKQDLRGRLDKDRLPTMQDAKARRCWRIARYEPSISDDEQYDEKEPRNHRARIPETPRAALMSDGGSIISAGIFARRSAFGSGFEGRLFGKPDILRKIARNPKRKDRGSLLQKTGHTLPTVFACAHIIHRPRIKSMSFHRMRRA